MARWSNRSRIQQPDTRKTLYSMPCIQMHQPWAYDVVQSGMIISFWLGRMAQHTSKPAWVGQGDLHRGLELATMDSERKTWAHLLLCSTSQMVTISMTGETLWWFIGEREIKTGGFRSCTETHLRLAGKGGGEPPPANGLREARAGWGMAFGYQKASVPTSCVSSSCELTWMLDPIPVSWLWSVSSLLVRKTLEYSI